MFDSPYYLSVTDLKQYAYCPRVVFYERCLPHVRPRTYKMDAGRDAHEEEQRLAVRRSLAKYLVTGKRFFNVAMSSERLQLNGIIDEVVQTNEGEIFPVDYKLAKQASDHYRLQLAAYALMLEETEAKPVTYGYLYLIPIRKMVKITMSPVLYAQVEATIAAIHQLIEREQMPPPVSQKSRCVLCEFRRFCNDV
jgi:CRISPR-associated exonuclease Cas4